MSITHLLKRALIFFSFCSFLQKKDVVLATSRHTKLPALSAACKAILDIYLHVWPCETN